MNNTATNSTPCPTVRKQIGKTTYVVAPLMLYIFGCGIYTVYRQTWDQFLILLVAEFLCFVLFVGATAMVEGVEKFSGWLRDLI